MTLITNPPRIAMVAGEPSGDLLAASLLKGLRKPCRKARVIAASAARA